MSPCSTPEKNLKLISSQGGTKTERERVAEIKPRFFQIKVQRLRFSHRKLRLFIVPENYHTHIQGSL